MSNRQLASLQKPFRSMFFITQAKKQGFFEKKGELQCELNKRMKHKGNKMAKVNVLRHPYQTCVKLLSLVQERVLGNMLCHWLWPLTPYGSCTQIRLTVIHMWLPSLKKYDKGNIYRRSPFARNVRVKESADGINKLDAVCASLTSPAPSEQAHQH